MQGTSPNACWGTFIYGIPTWHLFTQINQQKSSIQDINILKYMVYIIKALSEYMNSFIHPVNLYTFVSERLQVYDTKWYKECSSHATVLLWKYINESTDCSVNENWCYINTYT